MAARRAAGAGRDDSSQDPSQTPTHPGQGAGAVVSQKASSRDRGFVTEVVQMLQAYFAGDQVPLETVPVDLDYQTPFLTRCAAALRTIPRGEVVTYGELAALAGAPGAARAAGSFCAHSHLSIFVPCHRVVSRRRPRPVRLLRHRVQAAPARPRGLWRSLTICGRSSRRSPRPTSATGSPSSPASSTSPAARISAAAAASMSTSTSRARRSPAGRSRCCARAASGPRSAPTRAALSTARPAISSTSRARRMPTRRCTGPACSTARTGRSAARRAASSPDAAVPPPTSAARCSARER